MNYYKWIDKNCYHLKGKTVAISGATGGIGTEICEYLAYLGAKIICLDRNYEKSNALINNLKAKYPNLIATHIALNLEDIDMVKNAVNELKNREVDYLILNAGAYKIPRHQCSTGYDNVFQINFVSPYYIARELKDSISARNGRVVAVSSIAHNYSKIDIKDIDFSSKKESSLVYGNAKRFLTYSLYELFNDNTTLSIVHPGITLTNITAHYPKLIFAIIKHPMKIIFMPPKKAALSIFYGLFCKCRKNEWVGPACFNVWGLPKIKPLNTANDFEKKQIDNIANEIFNNL